MQHVIDFIFSDEKSGVQRAKSDFITSLHFSFLTLISTGFQRN